MGKEGTKRSMDEGQAWMKRRERKGDLGFEIGRGFACEMGIARSV